MEFRVFLDRDGDRTNGDLNVISRRTIQTQFSCRIHYIRVIRGNSTYLPPENLTDLIYGGNTTTAEQVEANASSIWVHDALVDVPNILVEDEPPSYVPPSVHPIDNSTAESEPPVPTSGPGGTIAVVEEPGVEEPVPELAQEPSPGDGVVVDNVTNDSGSGNGTDAAAAADV
uniref:dTDP-glucose 4,6-dehydratase n=1 Tax=Lygus hesperus TaxID=30085 RepID=A0A0A9X6I0_LYGHE